MNLRRYDVLLLSSAPEMYAPMLDSLTSSGIPATAACSPRDASRLIERSPLTVLVDLVHGAGLDPATVEAINRRRGRTMVLALHAGEFGPFTESLWDLNVDGFCRFDDWGSIVHVTPQWNRTFALH
jgi:hypothetical protein